METMFHLIECSTSEQTACRVAALLHLSVSARGKVRVLSSSLSSLVIAPSSFNSIAREVNNSFQHMILFQFMLSLLCWAPNEHLLCKNPFFALSAPTTFSPQQTTSITTSLRMLMYLAAGGYQIVIYCYNGQRFSTAVGVHCPFSLSPFGCQPTLLFNLFSERAHSVGILGLCLVCRIQGIPTTHPHDESAQQSEL